MSLLSATEGSDPDIDSPNYTLMAGCVLAAGGSYRALSSPSAARAPKWFYELLGQPAERIEQPQQPVIDWDKPGNVEWAKNYLQWHVPISRQGANGDDTILRVAGVLKDHGISEQMALELMADFYNDRCEPPWQIGEGADADRLDVKVANAYRYLRQSQPSAEKAEAHNSGNLLKGRWEVRPASGRGTPNPPRAPRQTDPWASRCVISAGHCRGPSILYGSGCWRNSVPQAKPDGDSA